MSQTLHCYHCNTNNDLVFIKQIRKEYRDTQEQVTVTEELAGILCESCLSEHKKHDEVFNNRTSGD